MRVEVVDAWAGERLGPQIVRLAVPPGSLDELRAAGSLDELRAAGSYAIGRGAAESTVPVVPMTALPGLVDRHVHLGLVDPAGLAASPVVEVHDLGWDPDDLPEPPGVRVRAAGRFHTAPGGYPSGRSWAPTGSVRAVTGPDDAHHAVAEAVRTGSFLVKIALHTDLPLLDDATVRALVDAAHAAGLPAGVHAEGPGQVERAIAAGADILVHAPWTERLGDDVVERGAGLTWYSIHDDEARQVAIDNCRRHVRAGGWVEYGTDMGNGPTPVGVNDAELLALGEILDGDALLAATLDRGGLAYASPHPLPATAADLARWLAAAIALEGSP